MLPLWVLVLAAAPVSDAAWVRSWVEGHAGRVTATPDYQRERLRSLHAPDTLGHDAALRVKALCAKAPECEALAQAMLLVFDDPKAPDDAVAHAGEVLTWVHLPSTLPAVVSAAEKGPMPRRRAAMLVLGGFGSEPSHGGLLGLRAKPEWVEFEARPDERATSALAKLMLDDEYVIRRDAVVEIEKHQGPVADAGLVAALANESNAPFVLPLVTHRGLAAALPRVRELLGSTLAATRAAAITAAQALGATELQPRLLVLLDDPDPEVFLAAHRALSARQGLPVPPDAAVRDRASLTAGWKQRLVPDAH